MTDAIIIIVLAALAVFAGVKIYRNKKKGSACACCSGGANCTCASKTCEKREE